MRTWLVWLGAVFVFGQFYFMVEQKEALRRDGQEILLKLAPRDPRSMMQGDYMALNYELAGKLDIMQAAAPAPNIPSSGAIVLRLDDHQVGQFVRLDNATPLAANERRLRYRRADGVYTFGVEHYFIPEGTGGAFQNAIYGDIRVSPAGDALLLGLRDKDFHLIAAPAN